MSNQQFMRTTMILVMGAAFALLGAGCSPSAGENVEPRKPYKPTIYQDPETGCEYLSPGKGITPRMGADGKQICRVQP